MITTVDANDIWMWIRDDVRENLGWDGVKALMDYFEELEMGMEKPMEYDPSLFWSWTRGTFVLLSAKSVPPLPAAKYIG